MPENESKIEQDNLLAKRGPGRPRTNESEDDKPVTLTFGELKALIAESKQNSNEELFKGLAKELAVAFTEARKPYVSPAKEENERMFREQSHQLQERMRKNLEIDRQNCPHMQGSNQLSEEQGTRTSIWWHRLDSGTTIGLCSNCQREFWPSDPDYRLWMNRKSGNRRSSAGERQFVDTKAWEAREHPIPFAAPSGAQHGYF